MLSPLELENKRILTNKRKYDRYEMDEYLDMVFENYKELFNEYEEQKKQIKTLSEGIQYYRSIESTMQKALLLAEKTSKETKDAAILKAEAIEKDATNKATRILGTAEQEYTRIREKCIELVTQFNNYKAQLQIAANEQLKLITSTTFDIETPEIDKQDDVKASGLESVDAAPVEQPVEQPVVSPVEPVPPVESFVSADVNTAQPESFVQQAADVTPVEPVETAASVDMVAPVETAKAVQPAETVSPVEPDFQHVETAAPVEPVVKSVEAASPIEPVVQSVKTATPVEPAFNQASDSSVPVHQEPVFEHVTADNAAANNAPMITEERPKSNVYSYSATGNTNPLPKLSEEQIAGTSAMAVEQPQEQDVSSQFEMYTEAPVESAKPEPVSEKTMVLPDVKNVDRDSLRVSKTYSEEEQLQILSAETINLGDSIKAVKEKEMLEVPKKEESEKIVLEPGVTETPVSGQPKTGLDTILQSMTIGKKKKANGDGAEDPFEFLGSVDDF